MAEEQQIDGLIYEPRLLYCPFHFPGDLVTSLVRSDPSAFRNGEQFPIQITHVVACMDVIGRINESPVVDLLPGGDERALQLYALRIAAQETFYPNGEHTLIPLMHNCQTAGSTNPFSAAWKFDKPFIMSNRDTLEIRVEKNRATDFSTAPPAVGVAIDGYGLFSKRPYKMGAFEPVTTELTFRFNTEDLTNDNVEPIVITSICFSAGGDTADAAPNFSGPRLRDFYAEVRIIGNATTAIWSSGPIQRNLQVDQPFFRRPPLQLYGLTQGRVAVHKLPGEGWTFQPGEGVDIEVQSQQLTRNFDGQGLQASLLGRQETVVVGLAGYIIAR